jgi:hypothetical protein
MFSIGTRREFLRVGGLACGGLALPQFLAARALAAPLVKPKSVVFVYLHGGPSQIETFDPKMTAPAGVRSLTGEVATSVPGLTFGGTFSRLASLAHRLTVVRSYRTGDGNHDIKPLVGKESLGANIGSLYARVAGANHPLHGMPRNCALFPRSVDAECGPAQESFGKFWATGSLGSAFAPFIPGGEGPAQQAMKLSLPLDRLDDRRKLLSELDQLHRWADASGGASLNRFQQQAFDTITGGVADAFDLAQEDPRTVARYDTAPLVRPEQISRKWNNYPHYVDNARSLGKLLLLARRLCERGCGFVTFTTNFVWDMHADVNNATIQEGMGYVGHPLDHALSAFLEDVHERGLSDQIMLVASGEMGRTPKVNAKGGRDHWGNLAPLLLSGGGLPGGHVVGQSTRDAGEPATEPVGQRELLGTILHSLLDVGQVRLLAGLPTDLLQLLGSVQPIPGLLS